MYKTEIIHLNYSTLHTDAVVLWLQRILQKKRKQGFLRSISVGKRTGGAR